MLAARDQENLVHAHQTAAAGKPLNQAVRQLQPKTPGTRVPKTPFRVPLNDENNPLAFNGVKTNGGKGGFKGTENLRHTGKEGKLEKNVFATPMASKMRAPLGQKTTNAKATAFQTPSAHLNTKPHLIKANKRPSTLKKKAEVTTQPEATTRDNIEQSSDSDVAEPEYAPPEPIPLPDPPMELGYDDTFPQFKGMNLMRGFGQLHAEPRDEHGIALSLHEEERRFRESTEEEDRKMMKEMEDNAKESEARVRADLIKPAVDRQVDEMIRKGNERMRREKVAEMGRKDIANTDAKSAARALGSKPTFSVSTAHAPTRSSLQKKTKPAFSVLGARPKPSAPATTTATSTLLKTPLEATSRNTLGYCKGRNVSSTVKRATKPKDELEVIDQNKISPWTFREMYGDPPIGSEMWYRIQDVQMFDEEVQGDDDERDFTVPSGSAEEEEELFQLPMPDLKLDE